MEFVLSASVISSLPLNLTWTRRVCVTCTKSIASLVLVRLGFAEWPESLSSIITLDLGTKFLSLWTVSITAAYFLSWLIWGELQLHKCEKKTSGYLGSFRGVKVCLHHRSTANKSTIHPSRCLGDQRFCQYGCCFWPTSLCSTQYWCPRSLSEYYSVLLSSNLSSQTSLT